jgi:hypothetical protein
MSPRAGPDPDLGQAAAAEHAGSGAAAGSAGSAARTAGGGGDDGGGGEYAAEEALLDAAEAGDLSQIRAILAGGRVGVNWQHPELFGETALHRACDGGRAEAAALLLQVRMRVPGRWWVGGACTAAGGRAVGWAGIKGGLAIRHASGCGLLALALRTHSSALQWECAP